MDNSDNIHPIMAPIYRFKKHLQEIDELLHVQMSGLDLVNHWAGITTKIGALLGEPNRRQEIIKHEAAVAKREVDAGMPMLHQQAVVALWAALEAVVRDFLAAWVGTIGKQEAMANERIRALRISLGEFLDFSVEEQSEVIIELLEESLKCRRRRGIERFEPIFESLHMSSSVDPAITRQLLELSQMRNLIVHKFAIADRRFIEGCPWLNCKVGDEIVVSHVMYHAYLDAADLYTFEIQQRVRAKLGMPLATHERACRFSKEKDGANSAAGVRQSAAPGV